MPIVLPTAIRQVSSGRAARLLIAVVMAAISASWMMGALFAGCPKPAPITLWAWERAEDLSFLSPSTSVAYYAGTIYLSGDRVYFKPRLQTLRLPEKRDHAVYPVFRIENRGAESPSMSSTETVVAIIAKYQKEHGSNSVQIDYDARVLDRQFYIELIKRLRMSLVPGTHISITALASWLLDDQWLDRTGADEAVAMLFSMGSNQKEIMQLLKKRKLSPGGSVDLSIGISANERLTNEKLKSLGILASAKRLYIFNTLSWTPKRMNTIKEEVTAR